MTLNRDFGALISPSSATDFHDVVECLTGVREIVEARLTELLPKPDLFGERLSASMQHTLLARGKRLRPAITLLTARQFGDESSSALDPACAVEMIHTASLIIDDLPCMDNACVRRGRPANHLVFGERTSILAAVAILNLAFGVVAEAAGLSATVRDDILILLSRSIGTKGVTGGQMADLESFGKVPDLVTLKHIYSRKAGALFAAAAEIGGRIAGLRERELKAVRAYGNNFGVCFQILDDLLDDKEEHLATGNAHSPSNRNGVVSMLGKTRMKHLACEMMSAANQALGDFGQLAEPLRALGRWLIAEHKLVG